MIRTWLCFAKLCSSSRSITGRLLRQLSPVMALPLSITLQQSFMQGCFPSSWKKAVIVPIYKGSGPKDNAASYRPISLCSTIGKTLEIILNKQLTMLVHEHGTLNSAQHGFQRYRSTAADLIATENHFGRAVNSREPLN